MKLSIDDCQNIIAFGNRASMQGKEADCWVELKNRIGAEGQRLVQEKIESEGQPKLTAVPDEDG